MIGGHKECGDGSSPIHRISVLTLSPTLTLTLTPTLTLTRILTLTISCIRIQRIEIRRNGRSPWGYGEGCPMHSDWGVSGKAVSHPQGNF